MITCKLSGSYWSWWAPTSKLFLLMVTDHSCKSGTANTRGGVWWHMPGPVAGQFFSYCSWGSVWFNLLVLSQCNHQRFFRLYAYNDTNRKSEYHRSQVIHGSNRIEPKHLNQVIIRLCHVSIASLWHNILNRMCHCATQTCLSLCLTCTAVFSLLSITILDKVGLEK